MNQILVHKRIGKSVILTCFLLFSQTSFVLATEDITGEWDIKIDYLGIDRFATLSISKKADGSLTAKWGASELNDVRFEDVKLTFSTIRKTRVLDFIDEYTLTLKEGKLTGTMSGAFGNHHVNGTRKKHKSPVLGQWDIKFNVGEREITGRLTISEKPDGTLAGKWDAEFGEHAVSNVKFQDGKLTYTRKSKFREREWESTFKGTIKVHKLAGAFKSQRGELPATGERVGAALVGKWALNEESFGNIKTSIMRINGDLTGWYEIPEGDKLPMKKLKLEGDQVTFVVGMGGEDQGLKIDFKGKLDGDNLEGKFEGKMIKGDISFQRFTIVVTGKKIETTSPLFGTWEFTRETSRGTRTSTLKIKEDVTGTYTYRDNETALTDLKVDGDQVSFKVTMKWQGREYPMEFKGKLDGTTLKGKFTTSRGTREATGKKID